MPRYCGPSSHSSLHTSRKRQTCRLSHAAVYTGAMMACQKSYSPLSTPLSLISPFERVSLRLTPVAPGMTITEIVASCYPHRRYANTLIDAVRSDDQPTCRNGMIVSVCDDWRRDESFPLADWHFVLSGCGMHQFALDVPEILLNLPIPCLDSGHPQHPQVEESCRRIFMSQFMNACARHIRWLCESVTDKHIRVVLQAEECANSNRSTASHPRPRDCDPPWQKSGQKCPCMLSLKLSASNRMLVSFLYRGLPDSTPHGLLWILTVRQPMSALCLLAFILYHACPRHPARMLPSYSRMVPGGFCVMLSMPTMTLAIQKISALLIMPRHESIPAPVTSGHRRGHEQQQQQQQQ